MNDLVMRPRRVPAPVRFLFFSAAVLLFASCAWPPPESLSEEEMKTYVLNVEEVTYYASEGKLEFGFFFEGPKPSYKWISEDYEGTKEFSFVDWITNPGASYFSVKSQGNLAYLRAGMTLAGTANIDFDTNRIAYLFRKDEHYDYYVAFAKLRIGTASRAITWKQ